MSSRRFQRCLKLETSCVGAVSAFAYDNENRLTEFTIGGSGFSADHTYDGFNRLIKSPTRQSRYGDGATDATIGVNTTNYEHSYAGKKHLGNIDVTNQQQPVNGKVWRWEGGAGTPSADPSGTFGVAGKPIEAPQRSSASGTQYYLLNDERTIEKRSYQVGSVTAGDTNDDSRYAEWQMVNGSAVPCRAAAGTPSELFSAYNISLDADRASSAATNHALQLGATDLEYEVTRVKSPVIGRDMNPLGRGDGTYYCNGGNLWGCVAIYNAKPAFKGMTSSGYGTSVNNQQSSSECERGFEAFLRLEAAGLCKREVEILAGDCCDEECAAERAGMRPISRECECCMCEGCGPCDIPDQCCCCGEEDVDWGRLSREHQVKAGISIGKLISNMAIPEPGTAVLGQETQQALVVGPFDFSEKMTGKWSSFSDCINVSYHKKLWPILGTWLVKECYSPSHSIAWGACRCECRDLNRNEQYFAGAAAFSRCKTLMQLHVLMWLAISDAPYGLEAGLLIDILMWMLVRAFSMFDMSTLFWLIFPQLSGEVLKCAKCLFTVALPYYIACGYFAQGLQLILPPKLRGMNAFYARLDLVRCFSKWFAESPFRLM